MKTIFMSISVKNTFDFVHCWPDAPTNMYYLRTPHRHLMETRTTISVTHNDRELEVLEVKKNIDYFIHNTHFALTTSCEMLAERIIDFILDKYGDRDVTVHVLEDGENGAFAIYTREVNKNEKD